MALPLLAAAVPALIGAAGGIAESLASGGGTVSGLTLPPELELELIESSNQNLEQINQDFDRLNSASEAFDNRINALRGLIDATIPSGEALARLRDSSLQIAESLGANAQDLIDRGFLEADDLEDLELLEQLESDEFTDPILENKLSDERARLEQDLRRAGASPATRAQALTQFDRQAEESRFSRTEELRTGRFGRISSRIGTRASLRESGLQRAVTSFGVQSSVLGQAREGIDASAALSIGQFSATQSAVQQRGNLRGERRGEFESLGQFDFSERIKNLLRSGQIGPGRLPEQAGAINPAQDRSRSTLAGDSSSLSNEQLLGRISSAEAAVARGGTLVTQQNTSNLEGLLSELDRRRSAGSA